MRTRVDALPRFRARLKRLEGKYRTALGAVESLISRLELGERPGNQIPGVGYTVYKHRLRNPAVRGGARKGYRVVYYAMFSDRVTLLTIYSKSEQSDISRREIMRLAAEADAMEQA